MSSEVTWEWDVFGCCKCKKRYNSEWEFTRHATTKTCLNGKCIRFTVTKVVEFPSDNDQVPNKIKPGPKGYDPAPTLRGTLPLFSDDLDARVDYLFSNPDRIKFLVGPECCRHADARPGFWLLALYGANAPKKFQSVVCHKSQVHYTTYFGEIFSESNRTNEPDDYDLEYETESLTAKFKRRVLVEVLELMKIVCETSVPARRPDLRTYATDVLNWMMIAREKGLSLYDSYTDRMDKYKSCRTNMQKLPVLRSEIEEMFGNVFDAMGKRNPRIP